MWLFIPVTPSYLEHCQIHEYKSSVLFCSVRLTRGSKLKNQFQGKFFCTITEMLTTKQEIPIYGLRPSKYSLRISKAPVNEIIKTDQGIPYLLHAFPL